MNKKLFQNDTITGNSLIGFEIKSDLDNYTRLAEQIKAYDLFFDENYLVVGAKHLKSSFEKICDSIFKSDEEFETYPGADLYLNMMKLNDDYDDYEDDFYNDDYEEPKKKAPRRENKTEVKEKE